MTNRKQKTAIALTGAVALASGAYALGTQVSDGSANAADNNTAQRLAWPGHPREPSEGLADRLGVDASKLRDALEDLRQDLPRPDVAREDFAEQLAKELGTTTDKVQAALERVRDRYEREAKDRRDELAEKLADRLNLDPDKVKDALGDGPFFGPHPARPRHP